MKTTRSGNKNVFLVGAGVVCALALSAGPIAANSIASAVASSEPAAQAILPATSRIETPLSADDRPGVVARARAARAALEMPDGARSQAAHVKDLGRHAEYDEVTEQDAAGQPVALTQQDGSGRLLMAVRFDLPGKRANISRADGLRRASSAAVAAGLATDEAQAAQTESADGWDVTWSRTKDGVPVRGDELRIHVREDGKIGSVGRVNHDLAAAPATKMSRAQARSVAAGQARRWSTQSGSEFSVDAAELAWVGPNAAFDAAKIGAAEEPYRLAWTVNLVPQGEAATNVRLVVLFVDAGDGSVIGGDVIE